MEFSIKDQTVVISQLPEAVSDFSEQLISQKERWQSHHVILAALESGLTPHDLYHAISSLAQTHKSNNKSFVLVDSVDRLKDYPEKLTAAPTIEEAFDLIEMEVIERDLGF